MLSQQRRRTSVLHNHCDGDNVVHDGLATFIVCLHFPLHVSIGNPLDEMCMGGNQRREGDFIVGFGVSSLLCGF
jgi:hypothetical protein